MKTKRFPLIGAVAFSALALTIAACAPQTSQWSDVEAPKENRVTYVRLSHSVPFRSNEVRLSPAEAAGLGAFIRDRAVGYGDEILLLGAGSAVGQRRQEAVATAFERAGLRVIRNVEMDGITPDPNEIRIVVGRHVVTPPECPNWSKRADEDFGNTKSSNIGCATTTNLGLMIANPRDLVEGESTGPADGELAAFRVESYRRGAYPSLLRGDVRPNGRQDLSKGAAK